MHLTQPVELIPVLFCSYVAALIPFPSRGLQGFDHTSKNRLTCEFAGFWQWRCECTLLSTQTSGRPQILQLTCRRLGWSKFISNKELESALCSKREGKNEAHTDVMQPWKESSPLRRFVVVSTLWDWEACTQRFKICVFCLACLAHCASLTSARV